MAQRHTGRIDRFAQMSKQEEIIAKKRQEILEKQRTAQLAKAVAAAQTLAAQIKSNSYDAKQETIAANAESIMQEIHEKVETKTNSVMPTSMDSPKSVNSLTGKTGKIAFGAKRSLTTTLAAVDAPPAKVQNSFCNDGSFLDHFKKILEKHEGPKVVAPVILPEPAVPATPAPDAVVSADVAASGDDGTVTTTTALVVSQATAEMVAQQQHAQQQLAQQQHAQQQHAQQQHAQQQHAQQQHAQQQHAQQQHAQQQHAQQQHAQHQHAQQQHAHQQHMHALATSQAQMGVPPPAFLFNPNMIPQNMLLQHQQQQQQAHHHHMQQQQQQHEQQQQALNNYTSAFFANAPPPPPTTVAAAMIMPLHAHVAPPPPPPPPQLPLGLANLAPLYMIPAPEPLQLNAIPAPKEFDLNAIPKPQLNLEAIQVPTSVEQQQQDQQLQQQQQDNNAQNRSRLPTTVEMLIETVAVNGDEYEEMMRRTHKNQLHPAMWFLFDKNCEQYDHYRQQLNARLRRQQQQYQQQQHEQLELELQDIERQSQTPKVEPDDDEEPPPPAPAQMRAGSNDSHNKHKYNISSQSNDTSSNNSVDQPQKTSTGGAGGASTSNNAWPVRSSTAGGAATANFIARPTHSSHDAGEKYDPESAMSGGDVDSDDEYMRGMMDRNTDNIKRRIECRNELSEEERQEREAEAELEEHRRQEKKKLRKSRWGEKVAPDSLKEDSSSSGLPGASSQTATTASQATTSGILSSLKNQNKPLLSTVTRSDPALLQYARLNYGSTTLSEDDWRKCEEHYKVNLLYQDMMRKRQEIDRLARSGKFKYEYDSDEDVDGGTWEHKLRNAEMVATQTWALALTKQSEGKHHIGDFLPPEELKKFMEQYEAKKSNRIPDLSDYKEYKLKEDNIGFQMLQKLGWKEGQGLGQDGAGIVNPVNKAPQRDGNQGLGISSAAAPENNDNEYDAYRKRMMLAYRFRPNPLNNPRRAYY